MHPYAYLHLHILSNNISLHACKDCSSHLQRFEVIPKSFKDVLHSLSFHTFTNTGGIQPYNWFDYSRVNHLAHPLGEMKSTSIAMLLMGPTHKAIGLLFTVLLDGSQTRTCLFCCYSNCKLVRSSI